MMVSTMYMRYVIALEVRMRGTSLPKLVPGTSARIIYMLRSSLMGSTAMINTSTPMPPIQCEKLRQSSSPLLISSTLCSMEEPVVVNPETISKNAST